MAANDGGEPLGAVGKAILDLAPKMAALGAEEIHLSRLEDGEIRVSIRYTIAPECEACGEAIGDDDPGPGCYAVNEAIRRAVADGQAIARLSEPRGCQGHGPVVVQIGVQIL